MEVEVKGMKKEVDDLTSKNFSLKSELEQLTKKFSLAESDFDSVISELKQAKDQCQYKEIEKQELHRQIKSNVEDSS